MVIEVDQKFQLWLYSTYAQLRCSSTEESYQRVPTFMCRRVRELFSSRAATVVADE